MKLKIRIQIVLAALGMLTALSMCGSNEPVPSDVYIPALLLVLLSGALLLNLRHSGQQ